jgi:hypothetical protein
VNDLYLEHAASLFAHARVGPDVCAATVLGVFVVSAFDTFCALEGPLEYNSDVSLCGSLVPTFSDTEIAKILN